MGTSRAIMMVMGGALAVSGLLLTPALLAARESALTPDKPRVSLAARGGIGSFTPAAADPRLASILARSDLAGTGFRFTPTGDSGKNRQVTVAVRARASNGAQGATLSRADIPTVASLGITQSAYNLGASIGWKRFALSGDVARIVTGLFPGSREIVSAGASYNAPRWSGRVQVGADRPIGNQPSLLITEPGYSLDVGGSYRVSRNFDVTAGVRYRMEERDRLQPLAPDNRRDSQAVYIGTAFKF